MLVFHFYVFSVDVLLNLQYKKNLCYIFHICPILLHSYRPKILDYNSLAKGTYFSAGDDVQYIVDPDSKDKDDFLPDISDW